MRHPPLQAPLLWQVYLGFWIAGVAAAVWPLPALCCALLLALADKRLWRGARLTLAVTLVLGGLAVARWRRMRTKPRRGSAAGCGTYRTCRINACACCWSGSTPPEVPPPLFCRALWPGPGKPPFSAPWPDRKSV